MAHARFRSLFEFARYRVSLVAIRCLCGPATRPACRPGRAVRLAVLGQGCGAEAAVQGVRGEAGAVSADAVEGGSAVAAQLCDRRFLCLSEGQSRRVPALAAERGVPEGG
jgi:hypothetical protein